MARPKKQWNRRRFVGTAVAGSALTIVPRAVLGGAGHVAPSEKITLAHIGMGTQGFRELGGLLAEPHLQVVAVCDPNRRSQDYVEWGKHGIRNQIRKYVGDSKWGEQLTGCPGGREVGREVVDAFYARQRQKDKFRACTAYADFRELLENERDVDAVKIMTPDHLHAWVAIAAMKKKKHVMTHKPIANRLNEARQVIDTARATGVSTHLLAYGSGAGNARLARAVNAGVIGTLQEIHNWTNRPVWPQYEQIPTERPPVPAGFDWDLWLGPTTDRAYHPNYTHTVFRGWYDFGGGSMADMGIYSLWPLLTGLELGPPISADAHATHACAITSNVSRPIHNNWSYPAACTLRFQFARAGVSAPLELFWYDGGMLPRLPAPLESARVRLGRQGIMLVGENGTILADFHGDHPTLFANGKKRVLELEIPAGESAAETAPLGRAAPWLTACLGGPSSPGSFLNAGPISDTVNLGTVALRAEKRVEFDSKSARITNDRAANQYLTRPYRAGWEL